MDKLTCNGVTYAGFWFQERIMVWYVVEFSVLSLIQSYFDLYCSKQQCNLWLD